MHRNPSAARNIGIDLSCDVSSSLRQAGNLFQQKSVQLCRAANGIAIEAYSPLMEGRILDHPIITHLAQTYGKSPAQIILRWHLQSGVIVIPKSVKPQRIQANVALFAFELSANDMHMISGMDSHQRVGIDPDTFKGY